MPESRSTHRYVILPASNSFTSQEEGLGQALVDKASSSLLEMGRPVRISLDDVPVAAATSALLSSFPTLRVPKRRSPSFQVLDTVARNDATLVEVSENTRQSLLARFPGVRIVPEVRNDLAWQRGFLEKLTVGSVQPQQARRTPRSLTVRVCNTAGDPLAGVVIAGIKSRSQMLGVKAETNKDGRCKLKFPRGMFKLESIVALPGHSYWPVCQAPFNVTEDAADLDLVLPAIDMAVSDARRLFLADAAPQEGQGVKVAVIDSGVDSTHPDLLISKGASFALGSDAADYSDSGTGHGTSVAGIIAGRGEPGSGIRGIAPGAELFAYRVIEGPEEQASSFAISKAIRQAVDEGVDLINLSLGAHLEQLDVLREIKRGRSLGTLCVVAAGNDGRGRVRYPAAYSEVIASSALGIRGSWPAGASQILEDVAPDGKVSGLEVFVAGFSNVGAQIDVIAPGVGIISTHPGGKYAVVDGTSFSCPIATGVIARELALHPDILGAPRDQARSDLIFALALSLAERCKIGLGALYEGSGAPR